MKRYFKLRSERLQLVQYDEFDGDDPTRGVNLFRGQWYWVSADENPTEMIDQPLSQSGILPEDEITAEEFEWAWKQAHDHGQKQPDDLFSGNLAG